MIFWHSTTFNNLINAESEQILMKKKLCQNIANKILGKVWNVQVGRSFGPPSQNRVKDHYIVI